MPQPSHLRSTQRRHHITKQIRFSRGPRLVMLEAPASLPPLVATLRLWERGRRFQAFGVLAANSVVVRRSSSLASSAYRSHRTIRVSVGAPAADGVEFVCGGLGWLPLATPGSEFTLSKRSSIEGTM